jgi:hypothetical protein
MAKQNNRNGNRSQGNTAVALAPKDRGQLEKQIPMWTAAFENASKIYQSTDMSLDIEFGSDYLKSLIDAIPDTGASQFRSWIQRFADVCKELGKYQQNLEEEYRNRWDTCNKKGLELEGKAQALAVREGDLDKQSQALAERSDEVDRLQSELAKQNGSLADRERLITRRELNAESGFERQNREALEQLRASQAKEKSAHNAQISQLGCQLADLERAIEKAKVTLTEAERQRGRALDEKEYELIRRESGLYAEAAELEKAKEHFTLEKQAFEAERRSYKTELDRKNEYTQHRIEIDRKEIEDTLSAERQRLDDGWADLSEARKNLDGLLEDSMEDERESHQRELGRLNHKLDVAWEKVEALKSQLADFKELESALGNRSVEAVLQQQDDLKQQNRDLRRKLSETDISDTEEQNEYLRNRVAELEKELQNIRPELESARTEAALKRVAATELQTQKQEKRVLESHQSVLKVHIDDLENRIAQLTDAHKTQTPFRAMSDMDVKNEFRATIELEPVTDLSTFTDELQHRIAQAERVELYYPLEDIRVLLGGLAMSQLHVFQGISGTGKTSLAKAFAKAVGGFCTDISVQAGWRDRDDLLGHYNAFEKRFYEKDTLQALYQAQTPRWMDTCNVVLLDEMNLSRPEQYFAEFLSALEKNNPEERLISLSETSLPNAPALLRNGRQILVPDNVWFIGTANHDETTNELADKTYDRAHVMTLPKQDHRFDIRPLDRASYSFSSLQKAFDRACKAHAQDVGSLLDEMTASNFNKLLGSQFELGWGNRFEKQALRFIPVMLEAGSTNGAALDHLLSTRLMRKGKVTGRYDVVADDLRKLQEALEKFWISANIDGGPDKSLALLEKDIWRLEGAR